MRICYISAGNFTHIGPYLEYFKDAGHDVHFVCLSPSPERTVTTYNLGIGKKYSETQGKWKYPVSMLRARSLIKQIKPDIIHAHYATSGGLTALVSGFHPAVITVHGSDLINGIKSTIWRPLLKRIFNHADCINVVSKELEEIALSLGINKEKIETFTLGIDTDKFAFVEKASVGNNRILNFICTRRLESVFNHFTILNALAVLKERKINFQMTFVGDGSMQGKMKQRVSELGLSGNIGFMGYVPNDDLPGLIAENDVYLSSSLWDGTSLSLLEAMATGLFPIVSDITANRSWIQDGLNGFLHEVSDGEDLANCIMKFLENPDIAQKAGLRNRQIVTEKADRKTNMKLLESVYKSLIQK